MLSTIERRQEIVLLTEQTGTVSVKQLAQTFDTSTVTIRNDLNELNRLGLLVRSRGGAVSSNRLTQELSIKEKHTKNHAIKQKLGLAVAALIQDGDAIILDSGSTTEAVAQGLISKKQLTVMTNGLNIASKLAQSEHCELFITGGRLRKKSMSFYGPQAEEQLKYFNFDKVILGVDGIDINRGVSTHYEPEAQFNRAMCEHAGKIIVVTDSSKFGKCSLHSIVTLEQIDILVTDSNIPQEFYNALTQLNIAVHIVDVS